MLGAFFCASPWPIVALALVAAVLCTYELSSLLKSRLVWVGAPIALAIIYLCAFHLKALPLAVTPPGELLFETVLGIGGLLACVRPRTQPPSIEAILAPFWYLAPLADLVWLHYQHTLPGAWDFKTPILLAVVPLWGGDTAAIFAGKAFGKHPLAPKISPKKTVEGGIANLLACIAVAIPLGSWIGYAWWIGALCGLAAGIFGQMGDLFESHIKRRADVKDSGKLLPGHGGLLDRIDSILFTAPVVALILDLVKYA